MYKQFFILISITLTACTSLSPSTTLSTSSPIDVTSSYSLTGLPEDIKDFQKWFKINSDPIPYSDQSPHTPSKGDKNIYLNQSSLPSNYPFPEGTIVVKESLHKSGNYVEWVSIMRKIQGIDPEHGDWQFHEYIRSGPSDAFKLAFKDSACYGCHSAAKDKADWVRYLADKN